MSTERQRVAWDEAAAGWDAHGPQIGAWLARATEAMLGMAGIIPGQRVLDVAAGAGEQTLVADAGDLPVEPGSFDAAVCRLGLMLFPDPLRALRQMHRALRPGGGICTLVFSQPAHNPCITLLLATACRHAGRR